MYYFETGVSRSIIESVEMAYKNAVIHPNRSSPDFHDFVYVTEGKWSFVLNGRSYDVNSGDVFILPAGSEYSGLYPCLPGTRTIFIHLSKSAGDSAEDGASGDCIPLSTVIHCQYDTVIKALFEEIMTIRCSEMPHKNEIMSGLFQGLACMLYRADNKAITKGKSIVYEAIELIKNNPGVIYTEQEVADQLYVSVKTLRTAFMKQFNKSFYRYQFDYKMEQAYYILVNNRELNLSEIAYDLGFYDEFHLSKSFKKKFGISPKKCREMYSDQD